MTANTGRARHVDNSFGGTAFGPFSITYGTGQVRCTIVGAVQHVMGLESLELLGRENLGA